MTCTHLANRQTSGEFASLPQYDEGCWLEFVKILIFITVDIFKHTAKKNKKIKRADQILPEVYGTTLTSI
jgi:hypothetical protein